MGLGDLFQGIIAGLAVREIAGQIEKVSKRILDRAKAKLASSQKEVLSEAWDAHFDDCPTPISKFVHAITCWRVAGTWRLEMTRSEYLAYRRLGIIGGSLKIRSRIILWEVKVVRALASHALWLGDIRRQRMIDAVTRAKRFAAAMDQAGACYMMGSAITIDPRKRTNHHLANEWVKCFGILGGLRLVKVLNDTISDGACLRNAFGLRNNLKPSRWSSKNLSASALGEEVIEMTSRLQKAFHELEQLRAAAKI